MIPITVVFQSRLDLERTGSGLGKTLRGLGQNFHIRSDQELSLFYLQQINVGGFESICSDSKQAVDSKIAFVVDLD